MPQDARSVTERRDAALNRAGRLAVPVTSATRATPRRTVVPPATGSALPPARTRAQATGSITIRPAAVLEMGMW